MEPRALIPAIAAALFVIFLLWKMRPVAFGKRGPLDPRIALARGRAAALTGRERALALCDAGALCLEANRATAAFGNYLRATRADPSAVEPIRGIVAALARNRTSLERVLWRHLATLDWEQVDDRLKKAIDQLPEHYRQVLLLWAVEGLKYREVADVLDVPLGTVMSRLYRARAILSEQLAPLAGEHGIRVQKQE